MDEMQAKVDRIHAAAHAVRRDNLGICLRLGGSYLMQSCSGAEIVCSLYMGMLRLGPSEAPIVAQPIGFEFYERMRGSAYNGPVGSGYDRLFVSACHYASTVYSALVHTGRLSPDALLHVDEDGWPLDMVAAEHSPGYETVSGSLGQTVSIAAGVAQAYKLKSWDGNIFCLVTDGELDEGQDWECFQQAGSKKLDNFVVVLDVNGQQGEGWTEGLNPLEPLDARFADFGWETVRINGHDPAALLAAAQTPHPGKPLAIICDTDPAHGVPELREILPAHFVHINEDTRPLVQVAYDRMCAEDGLEGGE